MIACDIRTVQLDTGIWQIRAYDGRDVCASLKVRCLAECSCIGVIFHLETLETYRRQGIALRLMQEVESLALREKISLLVSTVRATNLPCRALHSKLGFKAAAAWNNERTTNDLILFRKSLRPSLRAVW